MPRTVTLNVSITARHRKLIDLEVRAGHAASASEVVREGLRLYEARKQRDSAVARIRQDIEAGLEQLSRGSVLDGEAAFKDLERKYPAAKPARPRRAR